MSSLRRHARYALLLCTALSAWSWAQTCGVPGLAGPGTTLSGTLNSYHRGNSSVAAGATSIAVDAIDTSSGGSSTPIGTGDLLIVMQMQGAEINSSNSNCYGDGAGTAGCATRQTTTASYAGGNTAANYRAGNWEYCTAIGPVSGGVVRVSCAGTGGGTANAYTAAAATAAVGAYTFQVIRVPQYSSATLSGNVTAARWNGSTGGVASLQVSGSLTLASFAIDVSGRGFRGGGVTFLSAYGPPNYGSPLLDGVNGSSFYTAVAGTITGAGPGGDREGSFKGEGIAGTPRLVYNGTAQVDTGVEGYPGGSRSRGAPGNAGGGGNNQNGGGGGGGNGGLGGNGGGGWNDATRPITFRDMGGFGGDGNSRAGDNLALSITRFIMGGGGGAAHVDGGGTSCDQGGWGGNGGGIAIVKAGSFIGGGSVLANGGPGFAPNFAGGGCTDAAGGGGAGGTVYLAADSGGLAAVTVNAIGGAGPNSSYMEHGPGGGGGGGVVRYTATAGPGGSVAGGANGVDRNGGAGAVAWFSTAGAAGVAATAGTPAASTRPPNATCFPNLTVNKSTTTPTITASTGGVVTYNISVSNTGSGAAIGSLLVDNALPPGWEIQSVSAVTFVPPLSGTALGGFVEGAIPGVPAVAGGPGTAANLQALGTAPSSLGAPFIGNLTIPAFGGVTVTYAVTIPDTATVGTYHNSAGVQYRDPYRTTAARAITPGTNNTNNRCSTAGASTVGCSASGNTVGGTANTTYQTAGAVPGSNFSGLVAGLTTEDVRLVPDMQVIKTAPASAPSGGTLNYVITTTNIGRPIATQTFALTQATGVVAAAVPITLGSSPLRITDTLPAGVTLTSMFAGPNATCLGSATTVCSFGTATVYPMATGAALTVTATARITGTCTSPVTTRTNTVTLSVSAGESITSNNTDTAATAATCSANLQVTKTNSLPSVTAGIATTYTVKVINSGPDSVAGAVLTDVASPGLSCTTASCTSQGLAVCPAASMPFGSITAGVTISSMPPASTLTLLLTCDVTATGS